MRNIYSQALRFIDGNLEILDQQKLPDVEEWLLCNTPAATIDAIQKLKVRGAPLIGIFAALSLAQFGQKETNKDKIKQTALALRESRPTAVNLMNAIDRMLATDLTSQSLMQTAIAIFEDDVAYCLVMAEQGAKLINDGDNILTHCNTGGLATAGVGTALGVIQIAHKQGKKIHVYVDETRPLLQGGRLTAWELEKLQIPYTLICDNMAATLMRAGKIQKIFVGADRVAVNGDFANKVGTYSVAVLAKHHNVPFYPVAPSTTIDVKCPTGNEIPIEERSADEVKGVFGSFGSVRWSPKNANVFNPAFDVTPAELVTAWVIDNKILYPQDVQQNMMTKF